jgi:hypothetical protein
MQTITIRKNVVRQEESLCRSCYWAHIQKGYRESEEVIHCCFSKFRVLPFKVAECTDFSHKNLPTRNQMEDIALIIPTEPKRKLGGFGSIGFATESDDEQELVSITE